jgi:hypothetical protein
LYKKGNVDLQKEHGMNAKIAARSKRIITLCIMFLSLLFVTIDANAHYRYWGFHHDGFYAYGRHWDFVPRAMCVTPTIHAPMANYVCCELVKKSPRTHHWYHVWHDTWVAGTCKNADPYARGDMGCSVHSPVYTTGQPIIGDCQFSASTGKYR